MKNERKAKRVARKGMATDVGSSLYAVLFFRGMSTVDQSILSLAAFCAFAFGFCPGIGLVVLQIRVDVLDLA